MFGRGNTIQDWKKNIKILLASILLYILKDFFKFMFQLCNHIASGKKCQYDGNCSFAHSPEEREMWTYMKENSSK